MENNQSNLREKMESLNIEPDKIDDFLSYFQTANETKGIILNEENLLKLMEKKSLEEKLEVETDWQLKAKIAARLVALGLE